ncbi:MAG: diacylglycerol kinase family lipid kinase [Acidobacteria bacterium]|nr:diacylglycerol kinase family lipid kinase [Acidobacteriota bacterium]
MRNRALRDPSSLRALLLFNPEASRVSPRVRDVIAKALSAEMKLEVSETKRRDHARHLAQGAVHQGIDLVACLGGDGTLNEVINGLAGSDVILAPIPGGGTNVLARTLGLPRDSAEATGVLLERIRQGASTRRVNLGVVNGRYFGFCAGIGFDAAVVRSVERVMRLRKRFGDWLFVSTALRRFFFATDRRHPLLTLNAPEETVPNLHAAVVGNSNPYTYLGERPFQVCPLADLGGGLDLMALRTMRTVPVVRMILRAFGTGGHIRLRAVLHRHDLDRIEIVAGEPVPFQTDGDYIGEASRFEFSTARAALSVLA